jgi:predicted AlkP superfamily pyrophosphatase or phosphodiesterase
MKSSLLLTVSVVVSGFAGQASSAAPPFDASPTREASAAENPRLVLQITVDQLRGDMLTRFVQDRFVEGGFRYLLDHGAVYANAHHAHANTETIVGHATLATGAHPADHGMIGNLWFDRSTGEVTYNIEDSRYPLLTAEGGVDRSAEIDPTQKAARTEGRSPAAILVSTFSDELAIHTAGKAKIFGVSVKDRGAVSMAGHAGKAFWFSKAAQEFVTSTYYYEEYPEWVLEWNSGDRVSRYSGTSWELLGDPSTYVFGDRDDQIFEMDFPGYGRVFPHAFGVTDDRYFSTLLTVSPVGDEITADFAKTLLIAESLGQDEIPDYLAVSFSSTDYVGHFFGPSSLESEDNLLRLDRTLADFLRFVDERVGLDRTLVVLSADHGAAEVPDYLNEYGVGARYVDPATWGRDPAIERLKERFGLGDELVESYAHPYVYLNREAILEHGLDLGTVEEAVTAEILTFPGVAHAIPSTALLEGDVIDTPLVESVRNNFNPRRSGDIFLVFEPHWFLNDFDGLEVAATHGSPWRYDTYVPLMFAGPGVEPKTVYRGVRTVDVAPTLAAYLGIKPPSGSWGDILPEVMPDVSSSN